VPPPPKGQYSERARKRALRDLKVGRERKRQRVNGLNERAYVMRY
jgi:hypothetical protein